jgi:hypothetical protein
MSRYSMASPPERTREEVLGDELLRFKMMHKSCQGHSSSRLPVAGLVQQASHKASRTASSPLCPSEGRTKADTSSTAAAKASIAWHDIA